jgi:tetratricopeptide (TPR) repeat protein
MRQLHIGSSHIVTQYERSDVLRILRITSRQMQSWERAGLVPVTESYSFFDLLQIKKLRDLRAKHVRSEVILKSLEEMRLVAGMENPLLEAGMISSGKRVAFKHHGKAVEPITGQFVLDFAAQNTNVVMASTNNKVSPMPLPHTIAELFARGVALEEDSRMLPQAIEAYNRVLELDPHHAPAQINLGTLYYNRSDFVKAEEYYRQAIESDPRYALAYFDLGNVLDETGRLKEAISCYQTAIMLAPTYADAHYNVALAFEKLKQPRKALSHWQAYIKLDTSGPWHNHARQQAQKILNDERLKIVYRRP